MELLYSSSEEELNAEVVALFTSDAIKNQLVRSVIEKINSELDVNASVTMKITGTEINWYAEQQFTTDQLKPIVVPDLHRVAFSLLLIRRFSRIHKPKTGCEYVVTGREILEKGVRVGVELIAHSTSAVINPYKNDEPRV